MGDPQFINKAMAGETNSLSKIQEGQVQPAQSYPRPAGSMSKASNRATGAMLLIILFGILWVYGWASEIRLTTASTSPVSFTSQTIYGNLFILASIFTVIGFGLLLSYFKNGSVTAIFTSLFVVSFTVLLSPILQKFWFNIFITNFQGATIAATGPDRFIVLSLAGMDINIDFYNLRLPLANSIAQLVGLLALFGRLNPAQIVLGSLLCNFAWNLNHYLCVLLLQISPDNRLFDDYLISSVYLFGGAYALVASSLVHKTQRREGNKHSERSAVLAQIGTFFLFLSFCASTTLFVNKYSKSSAELVRSYVWTQAFLGCFFSLSASVISSYASAVLFSSTGQFGIKQSLIGTILGAIMYGPVAGTCTNIGAAIACGLFAGFLGTLLISKLEPALNKQTTRDSMNSIVFLVISFLGTFFIAPTVVKAYYNYDVLLPTLNNTAITNVDAAGWLLVYVGVSLGIGLVSGLICGLLLKALDKITHNDFDDKLLFFRDSGLKNVATEQNQNPPVSSQQILNN